MRTHDQLIDAVAARWQMVTPVREHMPLSPEFARQLLREQLADVVALLNTSKQPAYVAAVLTRQIQLGTPAAITPQQPAGAH